MAKKLEAQNNSQGVKEKQSEKESKANSNLVVDQNIRDFTLFSHGSFLLGLIIK